MKLLKYILLISLFHTIGCSNFLEEEPIKDISIDFLYNTPEGIKTAAIGLYTLNRNHIHIWPEEGARHLWEFVQTDLVIPAAGYLSIIGQFDKSAMSPHGHGSTILKVTWRDFYKIIDRCNALIEAAEKIEGMNETERITVLAEAKYFRAHSLFMLWKTFNNVYIKTNSTNPDNVFDRIEAPSSKEEIFTAISDDLVFAIENLPWSRSTGKITQAIARHIKAKLALWQEDWQEAASQADTIINNGTYVLEPNLKHIFGHPSEPGYSHKNSSEALFVFQNEEGSAGGGPPTRAHAVFMANYNTVPGLKWEKSQATRGWGFCFPNQYLLDLYHTKDKRLDAFYVTKFYYNDEENIPDTVMTDDGEVYPQLGDEVKLLTTGPTQAFYYRFAHPSLLKFMDDNIDVGSSHSRGNYLQYRLSETYIIAAEAYMRMGMTGEALNYIKPLRQRAGIPPIFNLDEVELMKIHARELAFEGHRFFFLKRIGKLIDQIKNYSGDENYKNEARGNIKPRHINMPIPQVELDLLGPNYPQNEGY